MLPYSKVIACFIAKYGEGKAFFSSVVEVPFLDAVSAVNESVMDSELIMLHPDIKFNASEKKSS